MDNETRHVIYVLQKAVSDSIKFHQDGENRFRISTPFYFDDGDQITPILKKIDDKWFFSDEGNTFMRLPHSKSGFYIDKILKIYGMEDRNGILILPAEKDGQSLYDFIQAIIRINTTINILDGIATLLTK